MEVCSIKNSGPSCQVEQLASACLSEQSRSPCRLQAKGLRPWTGSANTASSAVRHRANGRVTNCRRSSNCAASRAESADLARKGAGKVLVTGGAGYFGHRLGRALASRGFDVILLDLIKPCWDTPDGAVFNQGDIRNHDSLYEVCEGVDCVFHTASYGMSGPEQLKKEQVESVNVGGTNNVINVCLERGVPRLVYTSTVNVVFAGRPIEDGDEDTVPCVPLDMHIDHYSRTKAIAEGLVLAANGRTLRDGGCLRTCVLRPSGIYGPEERRHLHRVMVNVERRLFSFSFGNRDARLNWVHVDNLVMAHVLAAEGLTLKKGCVASGQAYFINDGESVNLFEWLTPLFEKLGYSRPIIHLPVSLVYSAAILMERLHMALRPMMEIPLIFTRNEVRNIAVTHTFKIEKARRDLGFSPLKYDLADSVDQYLKTRPVRPRPQPLTLPRVLLGLLVLLVSMAALLFYSSAWERCGPTLRNNSSQP
ncbi:putative short-chain dehydrogenase/reductase family 42E member 2 [Megalops cyprinoides]|uniref:putative short-chain dehydrogenase/reductase family 42E member 2 n=1 Tax=Megalops cyprinoides TaxID=118141 RepID=UPI001863B373|nr:putative short-chain dehydrogenase/reductase family 42E member 2 [Megalops cyprinoides]